MIFLFSLLCLVCTCVAGRMFRKSRKLCRLEGKAWRDRLRKTRMEYAGLASLSKKPGELDVFCS